MMMILNMIIILISILVVIGSFILLIISLVKSNEHRRKRSIRSLVVSLVVCAVSMTVFGMTGDIAAPEITVFGATLEYGQSIAVTELAAATDNKDEDVLLTVTSVSPETAEISEDALAVDFDLPGDYMVTICAADQHGNESFAEVVVNVEDHIPPVFTGLSEGIEVDYDTPVKVSDRADVNNAIYAKAEDEITDVTISFTDVQIISEGLTDDSYTVSSDSVCFSDVGDYIVTLSAEDEYGNAVSETVQVTVADAVAPDFSGLQTEYILSENDTAPNYMDGVAAVDEIDGDVTDRISLDAMNVSYGVPGNYTVTYSVADDSGNIVEKSVPVTIKDTTPPVVILSQSSFSVTAGDEAPDYSSVVSVTDAVDGDVTGNVLIDDSAVDYTTPGTYEITYTVSDSSGNAVKQTATVTVKSRTSTTSLPVSSSSSGGGTVYITNTGSKYHTGSCRYLSQSKIPISKESAIAQGYEACKVCKP